MNHHEQRTPQIMTAVQPPGRQNAREYLRRSMVSRRRSYLSIIVLAFIIAACNAPVPEASPSPTKPSPSLPPTATSSHTVTPTPSPSLTPMDTPTPSSTTNATPSSTPDIFSAFSIDTLRARTFDAGPIEIVQTLEVNDLFTRYLIAYPSDGLRITGMMNIPNGADDQRYPVVILNHGYIDPASYVTGSGTHFSANYLAQRGYLTLSPDYRGHAGSDGSRVESGSDVRGQNTFRVDFTIDVLNILHAIKSLPQADASRIGMWGHSMGGGITLKVLTVDQGTNVKAAVLYGAMSGDEVANLRHIDAMWRQGIFELVASFYGSPEDQPQDYERISPLTFLADIAAPVSIHHGTLDDQVPLNWSQDLNQRLLDAGKAVEYFEYEGANHSFLDAMWDTFMQRVVTFFDQHL